MSICSFRLSLTIRFNVVILLWSRGVYLPATKDVRLRSKKNLRGMNQSSCLYPHVYRFICGLIVKVATLFGDEKHHHIIIGLYIPKSIRVCRVSFEVMVGNGDYGQQPKGYSPPRRRSFLWRKYINKNKPFICVTQLFHLTKFSKHLHTLELHTLYRGSSSTTTLQRL